MTKTLSFVLFTAAIGCGDNQTVAIEPDAPQVTPDSPAVTCKVTPGAWSAPNFATNAADALALRAQIDLLTGNATMRGAETGTVVVDEVSDLQAIYDGGTPALSANVHASFDLVIDDAFPEFVAAVAAGQQDLVVDGVGWSPGTDGGLFAATRKAAFNTGAVELRQIVDKGLFAGGGLYHYAIGLTEGTIDEATIDKIAAAWGSNETLDPATKTDSANYSFIMGFHAAIAKGLTDAKAYAADPDCNAERDAAIVSVFRNWEQAMYARHVFYANVGVTKLATAAAGNAGDDQRADALHEFSEGLGLAIGFRGVPHPTAGPLANAGRVIADADIDAIMTSLRIDLSNLAASTVGSFVADTTAFQDGVTAVETRVKQVYSLSDADIISYRAGSINQ